jgi:uncharacterized protein (TIGR02996 family)
MDFHPEELALLAAIHTNPREDSVRLVYADWLDEHDRPEQAAFLRLAATAPPVLVDGDSEAEREELARCLALRQQLRVLRPDLDRAWLKAVGDKGRAGEVVVDNKFNVPRFGVIIKETASTVIVTRIGRRQVPPRNGPYGPERPLLPTAEELAKLMVASEGVRCLILDNGFRNEREMCWYRYWEGKDEYYYPD